MILLEPIRKQDASTRQVVPRGLAWRVLSRCLAVVLISRRADQPMDISTLCATLDNYSTLSGSFTMKWSRMTTLPRCLRGLSGTNQHQFRHFQIHFVTQRFGSPGKLVGSAGHTKLPLLLRKLALASCREERRSYREENRIERTTTNP